MKTFLRMSIQGIIGGAALLTAGILLLIFASMTPLSWILIVMGLVAFFSGLINVTTSYQAKKNTVPQEIKNNLNDERNAAIMEKTKAAAHDFLTWAMWAVIILLAAMQVDLWITLVLAGVQIAQVVVSMVAMFWLRKRM